MAYGNLVNIACTDKTEFFCRMRDFMCKRNGTYDYSTTGIGWTLHDAVYAVDEDNPAINDYFVMYSPGESGDEDLYIKCTWISGYLKFQGYQSWDSTTHAGSSNYYISGNNLTLAETDAKILWVYGDLDFLACISKLTDSDYRTCYFGKVLPAYSDVSNQVANCASVLSSGSDVSITVGVVPSNWAVGTQLYIRTSHNDAMATVDTEKITIKTLVGTTITADLVNNYTANSKLSDHVGYLGIGTTQIGSTMNALITPDGSVSNQAVVQRVSVISTGDVDPDALGDRIGITRIYISKNNVGLMGYIPFIRYTPTHNAYFDAEDVLTEVDGTEWRCFHNYYNKYLAFKEV